MQLVAGSFCLSFSSRVDVHTCTAGCNAQPTMRESHPGQEIVVQVQHNRGHLTCMLGIGVGRTAVRDEGEEVDVHICGNLFALILDSMEC